MTGRATDRFVALAAAGAGACIGVDPSDGMLTDWGLPDTADGLRHFCDVMLQAGDGVCGIVKFQSAYFERHGPDGIAALRDAARDAKARGYLTILDCKRGDIGSTTDGYAAAYLRADSPLAVDAVTATPYLGVDALAPLMVAAQSSGRVVFVVVKSSNAAGAMLQRAVVDDGRTVAEYVADCVTEYNPPGGTGSAGAVIGATDPAVAAALAGRLPRSVLLVPGAGAQGGSLADTAGALGGAALRAVFSSSRQLAAGGPSIEGVRAAVLTFGADVKAAVGAIT